MSDIRPITLPCPGFEAMRREARGEGISFVERLADEWAGGENRFDGPGEILMGALDDGVLIAVGGLNRDPFLADPGIGRIRRVFVRPAWRHRGLASTLVRELLEAARRNFRVVRLRAETPYAAGLYESLGFIPVDDAEATHIFPLRA